MAVTIDGTTGVSLVQDGVVTAADLASGAITGAALPAGSVLQVKQVVTDSEFYFTSTSFVDTGFSISITPTASDSSILIMLMGGRITPGSGNGVHVQVRRNTTEISPTNNKQRTGFGANEQFPLSLSVLDDSHNTTTEISYKVYALSSTGSGANINNSNDHNFSITAMEIAG